MRMLLESGAAFLFPLKQKRTLFGLNAMIFAISISIMKRWYLLVIFRARHKVKNSSTKARDTTSKSKC